MTNHRPENNSCSSLFSGSLVSIHNLLSVGLQIFVCFLGQMVAVILLENQTWYNPPEPGDDVDNEVVVDYLTTVVFTVSCYQYHSISVVFSRYDCLSHLTKI